MGEKLPKAFVELGGCTMLARAVDGLRKSGAIDRVVVINPRERNPRSFKEITDNIAKIGLKRPITVTRREERDGEWFDLVCGQGRLEAYKMLEQTVVPAMVVVADADDCLIASLVENCARRHPNAIELLEEVSAMQKRGQSNAG